MAVRKKTVVYWITLIASLALNLLGGGGVVPPLVNAPALIDTCPDILGGDAGAK